MSVQDQILAEVTPEVSEDTYGRFVIQPLERGFGTTIGNALRRVLLAYIPGAAITSIKIDGILHEFSTIPGVSEDASEIILNLKEVRFKLIDSKPDKISLHLKGPGEFIASKIGENTQQFVVLNPDHHICTMNEKANFNMELRISQGIGWIPAEKNKTLDYPLGTIFIDSIFTPVKNVVMKVENLPGTAGEVLEKLTLEIETDGSINPEDSLSYAANLLRDYFSIFSKVDESAPVEIQQDTLDENNAKIRNLLKKSVDEMELSVRAYNCLKANNIKVVADLVSKEESEMLKFKNFGRKSLNELMNKLKEMGLEFGMDVKEYIGGNES
jgi:DNA-directed RNA polymerase subunit alpha